MKKITYICFVIIFISCTTPAFSQWGRNIEMIDYPIHQQTGIGVPIGEFYYWREAYRKGNYKIAIKYLRKVPAQWDVMMFLGICLYLNNQPKPAVQALRKADELSELAMKEEIRWYLAQALLLKREKEEAVKLLEWLAEQPGKTYPQKAKTILVELRTF